MTQMATKHIRRFFNGKTVLDVGTGRYSGGWHQNVVRLSESSVGVDIDKISVKEYQENRYDVLEGDILTLDLKKKFDVVISGETIEHVQDQQRFIEGLKRHTCQNGCMIITTPNANSFANFVYNLLLKKIPETKEHVLGHRLTTLTNLLREHGLKVVNVFYYTPKVVKKTKRVCMKNFLLSVIGVAFSTSEFLFPRTGMIIGVVAKFEK